MKNLILITVIFLVGCALTENLEDGYQVGDLSKSYCEANTIESRKYWRELIESTFNITVKTNYCLTVGLIDMMVNK